MEDVVLLIANPNQTRSGRVSAVAKHLMEDRTDVVQNIDMMVSGVFLPPPEPLVPSCRRRGIEMTKTKAAGRSWHDDGCVENRLSDRVDAGQRRRVQGGL
jgi:hypothetical protein